MTLQIPTDDHLSRCYYELAKIGADCVGSKKAWPYKFQKKEELVSIAADLSRYDPRLFDIIVLYFINHWNELNPYLIRSTFSRMETPAVFGVIIEFMKEVLAHDNEAAKFAGYITSGLKAVSPQYFFHNLYNPGSNLARRATEESLAEYKKWGFFACERPVVDTEIRKEGGSFDKMSRTNILRRLLKKKGTIKIKDYLEAVKHSITRQQALNDLKSSGFVKVVGTGRFAYWKAI